MFLYVSSSVFPRDQKEVQCLFWTDHGTLMEARVFTRGHHWERVQGVQDIPHGGVLKARIHQGWCDARAIAVCATKMDSKVLII